MSNLKLLIVLIFAGLFISSCRTVLEERKMTYLRKGMTPEEVIESINSNPTGEFVITHDGEKIKVLNFQMVVGYKEKFSHSKKDYIKKEIFALYPFAFKDNRLIYWGFIQEYRKNPVKEIREIGKLIYEYNLGNGNMKKIKYN